MNEIMEVMPFRDFMQLLAFKTDPLYLYNNIINNNLHLSVSNNRPSLYYLNVTNKFSKFKASKLKLTSLQFYIQRIEILTTSRNNKRIFTFSQISEYSSDYSTL